MKPLPTPAKVDMSYGSETIPPWDMVVQAELDLVAVQVPDGLHAIGAIGVEDAGKVHRDHDFNHPVLELRHGRPVAASFLPRFSRTLGGVGAVPALAGGLEPEVGAAEVCGGVVVGAIRLLRRALLAIVKGLDGPLAVGHVGGSWVAANPLLDETVVLRLNVTAQLVLPAEAFRMLVALLAGHLLVLGAHVFLRLGDRRLPLGLALAASSRRRLDLVGGRLRLDLSRPGGVDLTWLRASLARSFRDEADLMLSCEKDRSIPVGCIRGKPFCSAEMDESELMVDWDSDFSMECTCWGRSESIGVDAA